MSKYLGEFRSLIVDAHKQTKTNNERIDALKESYKSGNISKNAYESTMDDLKQQKVSAGKIMTELNKIVEKYQEDLNQWAVLKGEDLTDDTKLLNTTIELSAKEYEALEDKYKNNFSMMRAIRGHAEKSNVNYNQRYSIDPEEKIKELTEVREVALNIAKTLENDGHETYMSMLWSDEEKFNNLYADSSRITETVGDQ